MPLLFRRLRVHQIFGANTDVGKTVITTALVKASAGRTERVFYLKPVSTGAMKDADDGHIKRFVGRYKDRVQADCLYRFDEPVSPHLAAKAKSEESDSLISIPTDDTFVNAVAAHVRKCASGVTAQSAHMYIETAGGVHSPTLLGTSQADCYRPLFLPTILVGDSRLGGISSTISAYESLLLRGYIVDAVTLFKDDYYRNWEYLVPYFAEKGIKVAALNGPPPLTGNEQDDIRTTTEYYDAITSPNTEEGVDSIVQHLDERHDQRLQELDSMATRSMDAIWWPFVQHGLVKSDKDVNVIDSASSDFFSIYNNSNSSTSVLEPQLDSSASWWTQALGHANPQLTMAAARAAGRYGHVMFPQATHLPALKLAESLINEGPGKGWASRAFFSDDGSTGMEVALKMALRAYTRARPTTSTQKPLGILGLKGSYHGDTIGAMDACEKGVYTCEWHNGKGYWLDPPTVSIKQGRVVVTLPPSIAETTSQSETEGRTLSWVYDMPARLQTPLADVYRKYLDSTLKRLRETGDFEMAALVLEPLVMGAGGMIFVDPLFQRVLIDVVRGPTFTGSETPALPVIFDEVFVGLYRIGMQNTAPLLGVNPDISVHAKILTGGLVPLSITLASNEIFQAYLNDNKGDALLHGHSYTAYPIGCEVANETLKVIANLSESDSWKTAQDNWRVAEGAERSDEKESLVWSFWDPQFIQTVSRMPGVDEVMTLGTVLAIKVENEGDGYLSKSAQTRLQSLRPAPSDDGQLSSAPGGAPFGVHFRTLGDVAYFMTSLNTSPNTIRALEDKIWNALRRK